MRGERKGGAPTDSPGPQDYIAENSNLMELHEDIEGCDKVLAAMEDMLSTFQNNLGSISTEIRQLQEESVDMSQKLNNRKGLEEVLGKFVDDVCIPPQLVATIVEGEVNDDYLEFMLMLNKKLKVVSTDSAVRASKAFKDVDPELEKLRVKAITKAREFLLQRIYDLRKPKTNVQIQQQTRLLKYRYLVSFLKAHGPETHAEVRNAYVDTLSRIYSSYFRTYLSAVERLQRQYADRSDVIGLEDNQGGVLGGLMSGMKMPGKALGKALRNQNHPFVLGERIGILEQLDKPAIIPHVAESEGKKFPYEALYRSLHKLLLDTSTSEYLFCSDFWGESAVFDELMAPVLGMIKDKVDEDLPEINDALCVLLTIRINHHHQIIMQRRRAPCLDNYLDGNNLRLWPRFKALFDLQLASIREGCLKGPPTVRLFDEIKPHAVSQRFADFFTSMHLLNCAYQDGQLVHNLERMRTKYCDVIRQNAAQYKDKGKALAWIINNQYLVTGALRAGNTLRPIPGSAVGDGGGGGIGGAGKASLDFFEKALADNINQYVENVLKQHFGPMVTFVKNSEAEALPDAASCIALASPILVDFTKLWKNRIQAIHKQVTGNFVGGNGTEMLKAIFTQLLLYYTRILDILKGYGNQASGILKEAVTVPSIMYEIKKYSRS